MVGRAAATPESDAGGSSLSTRAKLLANRKFRWLLLAECVSTAGTELSLVAVSIAILQNGGSASDLGLVLMARTIPPLAILLFGGVLTDRVPRGRLMLAATLVALAVQLGLGLSFLTGSPGLLVIVMSQAVLGAATALFRPAVVGLLPQLLPERQLQSGNSLLAIAGNTASIVGPASAGLLLLFMSPAYLILFDAATFALAAVFIAFLWNVRLDSTISERYWRQFGAGWIHVVGTRWLRITVLQQLVFQACFAVFFVLGPALAQRESNGGSVWALMATGFGVGAILGSFIALRFRPRVPLLAMQFILVASVPLFALMATSLPLLLIVPLTLLAGASISLADTLWGTYLQQVTPGHMLGRVSSITNLSSASLRPFGYLLAGQIAVLLGTEAAFAIAGALLAASIASTFYVVAPLRATLISPTTAQEAP